MDKLEKYNRDCRQGRAIARLAIADAQNQEEPMGVRLHRIYEENLKTTGMQVGFWQQIVESL